MSREAIGENGAILGSNEYWSRVNRATFLGGLMGRLAETDYRGLLHKVGSRAGDAIEEIYEDLQEHRQQLVGIPADRRSALAKQVRGLYDVCRRGNSVARRSDDCLSMLQLHGFSGNPCSDERAIQNALRKIKNNPDFSSGECVELLEKAADFGISFAAGCSEKKRAFLQDIAKGKDKDFLQEVAETYKRSRGTADTRGKCGYSIGSSDYLTHMERAVFQRDLPVMNSARWGNPNYDALLTDALEAIAHRLERDLETNERDNNYITDDTAARLKDAVSDLADCGVGSGFLSSKIDKLAWFVGGDATKIRQLQGKLNELGVGGHLTEDGVYGRETLAAWERYWKDLTRGTVPTLTWIDPLQSSHTRIYSRSIQSNGTSYSSLRDFSARSINPKGTTVFRVDAPHSGSTRYHINTVEGRSIKSGQYTASELQLKKLNALNHAEISEDAYRVLKNFEGVAKKIRVAGKVLLVAGIALDALELHQTIEGDLHDADRKIGRKTCAEAVSIGGSWAMGALGAKLGAMAGATIGTAILPGVGTAIGGAVGGLAIGLVGSYAGDKLGNYVVDITRME